MTIAECFVSGVGCFFPQERYADKYEGAINKMKISHENSTCGHVDRCVTSVACCILCSPVLTQSVGYLYPEATRFISVVAPIECLAICGGVHLRPPGDRSKPCVTQGIGLESSALCKTFC